MRINARIIGSLVGFIVALLFVFFNWKVVILVLGLSLLGYISGLYVDAGEQVKRKLRELFSLFFS